jgi:hypothetical protein
MRSRWGRPEEFKGVSLPTYSRQDAVANGTGPGDPRRGAPIAFSVTVRMDAAAKYLDRSSIQTT